MSPQMEKAPLRGTRPDVGVLEKSTREAEVSDASVHTPNTIATGRIPFLSDSPKNSSNEAWNWTSLFLPSEEHKPSSEEPGTTNGALQDHNGVPLAEELSVPLLCEFVTPSSASWHPAATLFQHTAQKKW